MWKKYFNVVNIVPGPVIVQGFGTVDFSREDLPVELCTKLYEADCRYLEITTEGKADLFGIKPEKKVSVKTKSTTKKRRKKSNTEPEQE